MEAQLRPEIERVLAQDSTEASIHYGVAVGSYAVSAITLGLGTIEVTRDKPLVAAVGLGAATLFGVFGFLNHLRGRHFDRQATNAERVLSWTVSPPDGQA